MHLNRSCLNNIVKLWISEFDMKSTRFRYDLRRFFLFGLLAHMLNPSNLMASTQLPTWPGWTGLVLNSASALLSDHVHNSSNCRFFLILILIPIFLQIYFCISNYWLLCCFCFTYLLVHSLICFWASELCGSLMSLHISPPSQGAFNFKILYIICV
jgi:hypothetical protein